jgi:hypothetical protein
MSAANRSSSPKAIPTFSGSRPARNPPRTLYLVCSNFHSATYYVARSTFFWAANDMAEHRTTIECATYTHATATREMQRLVNDYATRAGGGVFPLNLQDEVRLFSSSWYEEWSYLGQVYINTGMQLM